MSCHDGKIFSSKQTRVSIQNGNTRLSITSLLSVLSKKKSAKKGENHLKSDQTIAMQNHWETTFGD